MSPWPFKRHFVWFFLLSSTWTRPTPGWAALKIMLSRTFYPHNLPIFDPISEFANRNKNVGSFLSGLMAVTPRKQNYGRFLRLWALTSWHFLNTELNKSFLIGPFLIRPNCVYACSGFKILPILVPILTLFYLGSGKTLLPGGGPLWPPLIFCYITKQKVVLTPKTCSQIKFLMFGHPFTPLFQHSRQ